MTPHLSSGRYVISNNALGESVGHLRGSLMGGPILATSDRLLVSPDLFVFPPEFITIIRSGWLSMSKAISIISPWTG